MPSDSYSAKELQTDNFIGSGRYEVAEYSPGQQTVLQGRTMVRLLLDRVRPDLASPGDDDVPDVRGVDRVVLPVDLVIRESG